MSTDMVLLQKMCRKRQLGRVVVRSERSLQGLEKNGNSQVDTTEERICQE